MSANVGFGASVVAMNSYLPSLAKGSPDVVQVLSEIQDAQSNSLEQTADHHDSEYTGDHEGPEAPLIHRQQTPEINVLKARYDNELSRATSRISSFGIALGYGAGIFLLILALIPVTMLKGSTFALRLAIGLSGIWWALFSIPAALWLPGAGVARTTPDAHDIWMDNAAIQDEKLSLRKEIPAAWRRLGDMLRWSQIMKLRNTFKYLAAWFLLSDGIHWLHLVQWAFADPLAAGFTTITSTAVLFGKTSLNMEPSALILIGVLAPTSGILGSLVWPIIQRKYGWTNLKVLVILVVMASAIPAYGCLGFLGIFQGNAKFGGLTTQGEMYGLAVYFGECVR